MNNSENTNKMYFDLSLMFEIIKKNIILMIAVILFSHACGWVYTLFIVPTYTASEGVSYKATVTTGVQHVNFSSVTAMEAYYPSVIDFSTSGVVLDRADFYYKRYLQTNHAIDNNINAFIKDVEDGLFHYEYSGDENTTLSQSQISVNQVDEKTFVLNIEVTDATPQLAKEKLRLYILAANMEMKDAFTGVETRLNELAENENSIAIRTNSSKTKVLFIAGVMGVILAVVVVYIISIFDKTIKRREDLENILGVQVLSFIEKQGVRNSGR